MSWKIGVTSLSYQPSNQPTLWKSPIAAIGPAPGAPPLLRWSCKGLPHDYSSLGLQMEEWIPTKVSWNQVGHWWDDSSHCWGDRGDSEKKVPQWKVNMNKKGAKLIWAEYYLTVSLTSIHPRYCHVGNIRHFATSLERKSWIITISSFQDRTRSSRSSHTKDICSRPNKHLMIWPDVIESLQESMDSLRTRSSHLILCNARSDMLEIGELISYSWATATWCHHESSFQCQLQ